MELRFAAKDFQLGKGPFLNGDFDWKAKTGDPWWKNWEGTFSSDAIGIGDPKKKFYHFNDFFMNASCKDSVLHGKLRMGKTLSGSAVLDFSQPAAQVQADLKIEPVLLYEMPELAQFLPPTAKVSGTVSGQVKLEKGTFDSLPLSGDILVADGKIEKYNFDKLELKFSGDKKKISPSLVLEKDKARYSLEGTLESPSAIWDPGCKIDLNGPVHGEKLLNILSLLNVSTENHRVGGDVEGNLAISGTWTGPEVAFSMTGENLRFDNNIVPTAELHFSMGGGKISLDKNRVTLAKGRIDIDKGTVILDPNDPGLYSIDLSGTTQNLPIAGIFNMSSQIRLAGKLSLEPKDDRPTFEGQLSFLESGTDPKKSTPFVLAARIDKKVIKLTPLDNDQPQLVGQLDLSQDRKIIFNNIQLLHSTGTFSVDGTLDLDGQSHLTSDAGKIPIEEVGKWFFSDFPVSGTGNYHVIFDGNLNDPILTASFSVANGKVGDLNFDLLDGNLKSRDNTLYLGNKSTPLEISRRGVYSFQVYGKTPFALSAPGLVKVRNEEMDINATMDKGDFSLILLAGLAKKASGSMDFNAHVGGTMDDPVLTMDLDLKECQMVPSMVAQSIEDISGRIKVRDNKLVIQDLNGRIGQGRVFITSPPIDQTKMVLENFIPKYIDVQVITVGDHGLWLNVPCIMRKGEWGEIYFYGQTPDVPLRIEGPMSEPKVIGTALLDSGHYTFPAIAAVDEHGQAIDYKELAGVRFDLTLRSGKNCWYSNEFNTNYLELKVDPGAEIKIEGRDADKTPEEAGIKSHGESLGSKQGWLRYLGHEFKLEEASLYIPIGALPTMRGRATDKLKDVQIVTTAGIRTTDMDIWVDFKGTFGNIGFTLDSNPRFSTTDKEIQQNMLLSYIMFGRDMTGYSKTVLEQKYQDLGGVATQAAEDALNRVASNYVNTSLRPVLQAFGGVELDVKSNAASYLLGGNNSGVTTGPGYNQIVPENTGNTLAAAAPIFQLQLSKYLNQNLSIQTNVGLNHNLVTDQAGIQGQLGLKYDFTKDLSVNAMTGERDDGQQETKAEIAFHTSLPDIKGAKPGDTTRPRIMRFDVWVLGFDKVQIVWETDKITKAKVRILDADGNEAKTKDETDDYTYDHQMAVDGLKPESDYRIQLVARDPNGNEVVDERKVSTATE